MAREVFVVMEGERGEGGTVKQVVDTIEDACAWILYLQLKAGGKLRKRDDGTFEVVSIDTELPWEVVTKPSTIKAWGRPRNRGRRPVDLVWIEKHLIVTASAMEGLSHVLGEFSKASE